MTSSDNPAILQVIPALDAGGAERTTVDIARALVRNGFRALVASAGGRMAPQLAAAGGELFRIPVDIKTPHRILANAAQLTHLIGQQNVKLIHARSRAPAWSALIAAQRTRIPFIATYHGIYNAPNPIKRFYNSVMVKGDAIVANSQWTADHIAREHGIWRDRIAVIHRGVDLEEFDPAGVSPGRVAATRAQWGIEPGTLLILLPGRLTRWKGQLVFIEALALLCRQNGLEGMKSVIAGDPQGRADYVAELHAAISRSRLQNVVRIVPHVTDVAAAYLASDIVVSASTDPEAFGRVAAEASAMGRPVIATDHGGARETVLAGRSGLLVAAGDTAALASALHRLITTSEEQRGRMGAEGRGHVRANFSLKHMCGETLALYRALLTRHAQF